MRKLIKFGIPRRAAQIWNSLEGCSILEFPGGLLNFGIPWRAAQFWNFPRGLLRRKFSEEIQWKEFSVVCEKKEKKEQKEEKRKRKIININTNINIIDTNINIINTNTNIINPTPTSTLSVKFSHKYVRRR